MNAQITFIRNSSSEQYLCLESLQLFEDDDYFWWFTSDLSRISTSLLRWPQEKEGEFSLIHIPLPLYSQLLQPILQVLLGSGSGGKRHDDDSADGLILDTKHDFLNISITPIECSVVCHTAWARAVFSPILASLPTEAAAQVSISNETYIVFSVSSAGMEAGQRVIDLTAPLAMAGIPIFFITTYYTDFIIVPSKDRATVGQALLARGFEFDGKDSAYVAPTPTHSRGGSSGGPPSTPPPSNVAELQLRTFVQLKKRDVHPFVQEALHLVQCTGKEIRHNAEFSSHNGNGNGSHLSTPPAIDSALYVGIITALVAAPKFLSVTLTADSPPSLLLDKDLLPLFGSSIVGDTEGDLVAIFLDLRNLPLESTGIVCGVAGKLVEEMKGGEGGELSYLSTVRAGAVILGVEAATVAVGILETLLEKEEPTTA